MLRIIFLVSGGLGLKVLKEAVIDNNVIAVFTDRNSLPVIAFCQENNIHCFIGNPRNGKAAAFIKDLECDLLFSVNYLFIVQQDLLKLPKKYAVNVHGSLLPKYRGRTPHVWAIINGEKETGITAHLMDESVDNGKILKQVKVPITDTDTGGTILEKFNQLYPDIVKDVLAEIKEDRLTLTEQSAAKATYFDKRTPEDGRIDWNWFKERTRNWIRAQANPYPGAFFYYENERITVHQATFSDRGFRQDIENGTILHIDLPSIFVKTPNGVLELSDLIASGDNNFTVGKILK